MKKSRITDSQIVAVLKEGEAGVPLAQLVRKHGISMATDYTWRSRTQRSWTSCPETVTPSVKRQVAEAMVKDHRLPIR